MSNKLEELIKIEKIIFMDHNYKKQIPSKIRKIKSLIANETNPKVLEKAYTILGTFYSDLGKVDESCYYFNKALEINPKNIKPFTTFLYHEILKDKKDYNKINDLVTSVLNLKQNRETIFNANILNHLLLLLKNNNDKKIDKEFGKTKIEFEIINSINEKDFEKSKAIYESYNFTLSFCIKELLEQLIPLYRKKIPSKKQELEKYIDNCIENKKYDGLVDVLINEYKTHSTNHDLCFVTCQRLIRLKKYSHASKLLYTIKKYDSDNDKVNMLINLLNEGLNYRCMNDKKRAGMKKNQKEISRCFNEKNYIKAAENIIIGRMLYNQNIYNYYLGKYYYKKGDFEKAKEYFLLYTKSGYYKLQKCFFFLFQIEYNNIKGNYIKYYKKYLKVVSLNRTISSKSKYAIDVMERAIKNGDLNDDKEKYSKNYKDTEDINMTVEDFFEKPDVKFKNKKA